MIISTIISLIILGALTIVQIALIFGAPLGHFAWGGYHKILPTKLRIGSAFSIVIYAVIASFILSKAGFISMISDDVVNYGLWFFFAYLILGVFMNAMSSSKPERYTMTPVAFIMAVCIYFVAIG